MREHYKRGSFQKDFFQIAKIKSFYEEVQEELIQIHILKIDQQEDSSKTNLRLLKGIQSGNFYAAC